MSSKESKFCNSSRRYEDVIMFLLLLTGTARAGNDIALGTLIVMRLVARGCGFGNAARSKSGSSLQSVTSIISSSVK